MSLLALLCAPAPAQQEAGRAGGESFDVVLLGGRVMDPESGLDAIRNVGVRHGVIRSVTSEPLEGRTTIDATGLVVAPGFIDTDS